MMMKGIATVGLMLATANVALSTPRAMQDHDHDHDHGDETCACHSTHDHHSFSLDCSAAAAITASATRLASCAVTAEACHAVEADGSEPCQTAFFHLVYVHGACPHDTLTTDQEALVHQYDGVCASCGVQRPYDANADTCVVPTEAECAAANNAGQVAAEALNAAVTGGTAACSDSATIASWKMLLAYHDLCDADTLPAVVETAVHAYEEACEDNFCNTVDESYNPADTSACAGEDDHEHEHTEHEENACDEHDHDHRRRLGDHDHAEDECAHFPWLWVGLGVVFVAIGGAVFMKVKGFGCFAQDEKGSSG